MVSPTMSIEWKILLLSCKLMNLDKNSSTCSLRVRKIIARGIVPIKTNKNRNLNILCNNGDQSINELEIAMHVYL